MKNENRNPRAERQRTEKKKTRSVVRSDDLIRSLVRSSAKRTFIKP